MPVLSAAEFALDHPFDEDRGWDHLDRLAVDEDGDQRLVEGAEPCGLCVTSTHKDLRWRCVCPPDMPNRCVMSDAKHHGCYKVPTSLLGAAQFVSRFAQITYEMVDRLLQQEEDPADEEVRVVMRRIDMMDRMETRLYKAIKAEESVDDAPPLPADEEAVVQRGINARVQALGTEVIQRIAVNDPMEGEEYQYRLALATARPGRITVNLFWLHHYIEKADMHNFRQDVFRNAADPMREFRNAGSVARAFRVVDPLWQRCGEPLMGTTAEAPEQLVLYAEREGRRRRVVSPLADEGGDNPEYVDRAVTAGPPAVGGQEEEADEEADGGDQDGQEGGEDQVAVAGGGAEEAVVAEASVPLSAVRDMVREMLEEERRVQRNSCIVM
ncbi:hypothetical protein GGR50DRAFT_700602 [Xylaria sp. CBS 124048]|nr:hypothetical protein GGR50DRAFT_700602 [Xylaria sp. CBS 124048]